MTRALFQPDYRITDPDSLEGLADDMDALAARYRARAVRLRQRRKNSVWRYDKAHPFNAARRAYPRVKSGETCQNAARWAADYFVTEPEPIQELLEIWQRRDARTAMENRNRTMRDLAHKGKSVRWIAGKFGLSSSTVGRIVKKPCQ